MLSESPHVRLENDSPANREVVEAATPLRQALESFLHHDLDQLEQGIPVMLIDRLAEFVESVPAGLAREQELMWMLGEIERTVEAKRLQQKQFSLAFEEVCEELLSLFAYPSQALGLRQVLLGSPRVSPLAVPPRKSVSEELHVPPNVRSMELEKVAHEYRAAEAAGGRKETFIPPAVPETARPPRRALPAIPAWSPSYRRPSQFVS